MDDATLAVVIGDNIRKYRERANLTQGQLAEQAGVGTAFISQMCIRDRASAAGLKRRTGRRCR